MELAQDGPEKFLDPDKIIAQLEIMPGCVAADFGCGPGYFSIPFAKKVDVAGKLFALDVLPQALEAVESKRKNAGLANVVTMRVNLEKENGSKLEADSINWVIMKDMLFQNQKKEIVIAEAWRVLKNGGKILVVEWGGTDLAIGPERELRIAQDDLKKMFLDQKFEIEKDIDAGKFHYAFVAIKK
jgi:ubiquinone/menaquinone biosynthesis C-methylase UbiE